MSKNNLQVAGTDFDQIKQSLKEFMKTHSGLTDVDFEGSGAAVLLDVMAYNTFHNNVYLNAATNEMFLGTAQLRSNVVAHAAPLGYTPRSFTSAKVVGTVTVVPTDTPTSNYLTLPADTIFITKIENKNYRFQNLTTSVLEYNGSVFKGEVELYEGNKYSYRYVVNLSDKDQKFEIKNADIDTGLVTVGVIRNSEYTQYEKSETITNATATSKLYWITENDSGLFEVKFGDGVFGEAVSNDDIVVITYYVCNGAIPNGATQFEIQASVGGYSNVTFTAKGGAAGGSVSESIESVRRNATGYFETQNRATTWADYETLLKKRFGFIETISVWGGEDNNPPYYGRVFIAAKPIIGETLTTSERDELAKFIKSKNVSSIIPMFEDPDYIYLKINSVVRFNYDRSPYTIAEVTDRVKAAISEYVDQELEKFGVAFRYSNLSSTIDEAAIGVSSNETDMRLVKRVVPNFGESDRYFINFGAELQKSSIVTNKFKSNLDGRCIYLESAITPDGNGEYPITYYFIENNIKTSVGGKVGVVDYESGTVSIDFITITDIVGDHAITVEVIPVSKDYEPTRNQILTSRPEDINVVVVPEVSK